MLIYSIVIFAICLVLVNASPDENKLIALLLKNYNVLERPIFNSSEPLEIKLSVVLQQLINIDEKNQIVEVSAWLKYTWMDYKLKWKPENYDGVADIRFRSNQLWKPDILLYNSVDSNFDSTFQTNLLVYSSGLVSWIPPGIFKISCHINIQWFPFDDQECFFKFGSWTYDGSKIDLKEDKNGFDLSNYMVSGEWKLINTTVRQNVQYYECCPEPYIDMEFIMRLRRRTLYYGFNLIMPCMLITFMTLIGFTLPPGSGEKISLQITVMLSICIFQNYVADMSPPTSEAVPLLGVFFFTCMFTVSASVLFTIVVLNLYHRSPQTHTMSHLLVSRRITEDDEEKFRQSEWKFASMAVDRLFLIAFSIFIVITTVSIFLSAPYLIA